MRSGGRRKLTAHFLPAAAARRHALPVALARGVGSNVVSGTCRSHVASSAAPMLRGARKFAQNRRSGAKRHACHSSLSVAAKGIGRMSGDNRMADAPITDLCERSVSSSVGLPVQYIFDTMTSIHSIFLRFRHPSPRAHSRPARGMPSLMTYTLQCCCAT